MEKYQLVSDYRNNESWRNSFNTLAMKTFELDFRGWYNKGYWNDTYIPYSFVDKGLIYDFIIYEPHLGQRYGKQ